MKKKIALLLAGAMSLASLPLDVFANINTNRAESALSHAPVIASQKTALVERRDLTTASGQVSNHDDVDHWMRGLNFEVELPRGLQRGAQFQVELQNAFWFFDGGSLGSGNPTLLTNPNDWDARTGTLTRTAQQSGSNGVAYTLTVDPTRTVATITIQEDTAPVTANAPQSANSSSIANGAALTTAQGHLVTAQTNVALINAAIQAPTNATSTARGNVLTAQGLLDGATTTNVGGLVEATNTAISSSSNFTNDLNVTAYEQARDALPSDTAEITAEQVTAVVNAAGPLLTTISGQIDGYINAELNKIASETSSALNVTITAVTAAKTSLETALGISTRTSDPAAAAQSANQALDKINADLLNNGTLALLGGIRTALQAGEPDLTGVTGDTGTLSRAVSSVNAAKGFADAAVNHFEGDEVAPPTTTGGTRVSIPLIVRTTSDSDDATARLRAADSFNVQQDRRAFAISTGGGSTTTRIVDPQTSRNSLDISPIAISENRIGALPATGAFEITAPSGFRFATVRDTNVELRASGGISTPSNWSTGTATTSNPRVTLNQNDSIIRVEYSGLTPSTGVTGGLSLTGFQLIPNNVDNVREGDVNLNIRNVRTGDVRRDTITAQSFRAGTIADWNVNLSVVGGAAVPQLINGRLDGIERINVSDSTHKAATVRFEESVENAWWANRTTTFTLPEGVRVRQVEFDRIRNISNESALQGTHYNDRNRSGGYVRVSDNVITLTGLNTNGRASFDMNLWLNIESGFTGDVKLTLGGSSVTGNNRNVEDQSVVIAKAINPITVNAELTNVRVGYQFVPVGNFTITENVPGALLADEQVFISITDDTFADMYIASGFNYEVTRGNLGIRNMRVGTNLNLNNNNRNNVNVSFEISRESSEASVIEFSNVQVRMSNTAPTSTQDAGYDLVVWGPAVAANFEGVRPTNDRNVDREHADYINSNDFFRTAGIRTNYIRVGSSSSLGRNIVRVTSGSNIIVVGDTEVTMDTAAYVSPASDSMMVPVRFVSQALGIPENRVMWSPETSTVTIDAGERILQFQTNSSEMRINNITVPITNANGEPVQSEVTDERAFIPFRALGEALNIHVSWDAETSTAIFDPTRTPENALLGNIA